MSEQNLTVEALAVSYGIVPVLRGVSLHLAPGEVVGLIGPNGVGKTTTLRAISGLVRRAGGSVRIGTQDLGARPDKALRAGVVHVPEGRGMLGGLTALENIRVGAAARGSALTKDELDDIHRLFPRLLELGDRSAGSLSGGEQQMVAIARGLAARPRFLLIDELSLGLAPRIVTELLDALALEARKRRMGVLLVDQNVRALAKVCDRLMSLRHGVAEEIDADQEDYSDLYFKLT